MDIGLQIEEMFFILDDIEDGFEAIRADQKVLNKKQKKLNVKLEVFKTYCEEFKKRFDDYVGSKDHDAEKYEELKKEAKEITETKEELILAQHYLNKYRKQYCLEMNQGMMMKASITAHLKLWGKLLSE